MSFTPECVLPDDPDTTVWHYMDLRKFHFLVDKRALYFRRSDLLQDKFEGTYSRRQITWLEEVCDPSLDETERERRSRARRRTYLSCWCMSEYDLDLMWKAYVRRPPGVALRSSIRRLQEVCSPKNCKRDSLDISLVRYFGHAEGETIDYLGSLRVFTYKDYHFELDRELRIIWHPNMSEPTPDHMLLPVASFEELLDAVVLSPGAGAEAAEKVSAALHNVGADGIPVLYSRDDRELLE